jgi:hypothetical protein
MLTKSIYDLTSRRYFSTLMPCSNVTFSSQPPSMFKRFNPTNIPESQLNSPQLFLFKGVKPVTFTATIHSGNHVVTCVSEIKCSLNSLSIIMNSIGHNIGKLLLGWFPFYIVFVLWVEGSTLPVFKIPWWPQIP